MRIISATIYLGIIAGLCGVSSAAQDGVVQSGVSQKTEMTEDSLQQESIQVAQEYRGLHRQLMWNHVESIKEPSSQRQTDTLDDLIRQLHSLEIPQKSTPQEPNEPLQSQGAAATPSLSEEPTAREEDEAPSLEDILAVTLKKVDKITSPLQLADVLYRQGYYELAFENYCTVGAQLAEDGVVDHQWILFQKANCRRHSNSNEAIRLYNELIKSFPNSKWTTAATSRLKMIEWSQLNQTKDWVENETDDANNG